MNPGERDCIGISRYSNPFFAGLVVIAGEFHPIPFRTRPLKPPAPMVLRVNTRESRSPPGLPNTDCNNRHHTYKKPRTRNRAGLFAFNSAQTAPSTRSRSAPIALQAQFTVARAFL